METLLDFYNTPVHLPAESRTEGVSYYVKCVDLLNKLPINEDTRRRLLEIVYESNELQRRSWYLQTQLLYPFH